MPRKANRVISQATRIKMSRSATERQAKRREQIAAESNKWAATSLSAAAVSAATEISLVKSSVLARKETARQTIEDCDALLAAWDRLGL